jgi:hypothetical protein
MAKPILEKPREKWTDGGPGAPATWTNGDDKPA